MYHVNSLKKNNKRKLVDKAELTLLDGFWMASKNKTFQIGGCKVCKIQVMNKNLAYPLASQKVMKKYRKLIAFLTELLVDDDDSGDSYREALNQIEKFRLEIKNKYRDYLKKKELEMMSKQLMTLKKEASLRFMELQESYFNYQDENNRRR